MGQSADILDRDRLFPVLTWWIDGIDLDAASSTWTDEGGQSRCKCVDSVRLVAPAIKVRAGFAHSSITLMKFLKPSSVTGLFPSPGLTK
jgi:hypothetical protein